MTMNLPALLNLDCYKFVLVVVVDVSCSAMLQRPPFTCLEFLTVYYAAAAVFYAEAYAPAKKLDLL